MGEHYHILMAAGGTGGHIFPALAVADALRAQDPDAVPVFVGAAQGLESRLVPSHGYGLELVDVKPLKNAKNPLVAAWRVVGLSRSATQSVRLLRRLRPKLVIGAGGYASGPVTAMASLFGIPTAIMEQNAIPGLTNRLLARLVKRVFLSFESDHYPYPKDKIRAFGNPIRSMRGVPPDQQRTEGKTHILVFGGSQGAKSLNEGVPASLAALGDACERVLVRHQTGRDREPAVRETYQKLGFRGQVEVVPFIENMPGAYAWADLVICRAGATTVAELQAAGKPSILIPFPFAAHNHQEHNALAMVRAGASLMISDDEVATCGPSGGRLASSISHLLRFPSVRASMSEQALAVAHPNAANDVAAECLSLLNRRPPAP